MQWLKIAAAAALAVMASGQPMAQQAYPSQQIKMIVPFAAGALTDFLGRLAAEHLKNKTGQTVIVENRTGAGGNAGLHQVVQSAPDGHTIAIASVTSFTVNPLIYKSMPFDPMKDLVPVATLAEAPLFVTVNIKSLPFDTMQAFVAHVKGNPGKYNYGSSGTGTPPHIMGDQVLRQAGLQVQHVPYRGIAPAVTDLITGSVQMMFASPGSVIGHVDSGALRFLAAVAPKRLPFLPSIPTTGETGLPPYTTASWWGIVAHSATPAPIVARLNQLLSEIADEPSMRARLEKVYMLPMKMSASDMAAQLKADLPVWAKIVKDAGIKPE